MQVLTAEETLAAIEKKFAPLLKRLEIAEAIIEQNAELVDATEARRLTGMKDNRTLKKHFTPVEFDGSLRFSKSEIIRWKYEQSLHKAPDLKIAA